MTSELPPSPEEPMPPPPDPGTPPVAGPEKERREPWLRRSAADRYLAGVAGAVGAKFQFDPLLIRIGLVGLATYFAYAGDGLHPLILVPYFLAWAVIPPPEGRSLVARLRERDALQELAGALVLLAIGILVLSDSDYAVAVGLAALALALFSDRNRPDLVAQPATNPSDPAAAAGLAGARATVFGRNMNIGQRASDMFARAERPPQREPALWPLTLSLLLLLGIISILIDRFTEPGADPRIVLNLALLAIGGVLAVSFWRGRARVTILWALTLIPLWIAFSVADVGRFPGEGTSRNVVTAADLTSDMRFQHGYGDLIVDFREVDLADGSETTLAIDLTAGKATVLVPRDVEVKVEGKIGLGGYDVFRTPFWFHSADMINGTIDRTFGALGIVCFSVEQTEEGLVEVARRSGLTVRDGDDVADVIESAGFVAPRYVYTDQVQEWFQSPQGGEDWRLIDVEYYRVEMNNDGQLCTPEQAPATPAILTIEPTIGIGQLEINRVDIS